MNEFRIENNITELTVSQIYCPTGWEVFNYKFQPRPTQTLREIRYDLNKFMGFVRYSIPDDKLQVSQQSQKNYNQFASSYGCELLNWRFTNNKL
jgi:hypothetical protein